MSLKETFLSVTVLLFTLTNHYSATKNLTRDVAAKVCPYNDFCQVKASKVIVDKGRAPCCSDCSCDDDCLNPSTGENRCCPDKIYQLKEEGDVAKTTNPTKPLEKVEMCTSSMVRSGKAASNHNGVNGGIMSFMVIVECPSHEANESVRKACSSDTELEDFIWVSDTETGGIYRNRHCAKCHGVEIWKYWKFRTSCTDVLRANFSSLPGVVMGGYCTIINEAPDNDWESAARHRCYSPNVNTCNQTGLWTQEDAEIEAACQTFSLPFFQYGQYSTVVYKNVFCYICNEADRLISVSVCPSLSLESQRTENYFSALLDFSSTTDQHQAELKCLQNEVYDRYMDICRTLICPPGLFAVNGECLQIAKSFENLAITVSFRLIFDWSQSTGFQNTEMKTVLIEYGEDFVSHFWKRLKLDNCFLCYATLAFDTEDQSFFYVSLWLLTTDEDCQLKKIYESITNIVDKKLEIFLNETKLRTTICLRAYKSDPGDFEIIGTYLFRDNFRQCRPHITIVQTPCPAIKLYYDEIISNFNDFEALFGNSGTYVNDSSVRVCLSDYLRITALASIAEQSPFLLISSLAAVSDFLF